jgi:hypothetical protein
MLKYNIGMCWYYRCFCVDKNGKRTFGEQLWAKAENMTCGEYTLIHHPTRYNNNLNKKCTQTQVTELLNS